MMLQIKKWGMHLPRWGDGMPQGWEKVDQYSSGNNSVVTLRFNSVMIQIFKAGVTW